MLDVRGLTVSFRRVAAVTDVDLTVAAGEAVALVGASGAGKSTVARAVAGLVRPDRGTIRLDGADLTGVGRAEARRRRLGLHLVFQDPYAALPPTLRVADIVAEPLVVHRLGDGAQRRERVVEALAAVRLDAHLLTRYAHQLSGGERQRVAFARALVTRPRLILADEPTRMLDASLRLDLVELMSELGARHGVAVLHITHDLALARHGCARAVVMHAGRVVETGPTAELLAEPRHERTAALVAAARRTRATTTGRTPMVDIAQLSMDIRAEVGALERGELGHRVTRVDCYELERTDLSRFAVLAVPGMVDQEHLLRHRAVVRGYLDTGGVLVFGGQLHRDWLPGASPFVALDRPSLAAYRVAELADHPIFAGVEPDDLTFRRGVAGFFARGYHPPPPGAEVLVRLAGGQPVTYVDRGSTPGTIVVHANGDLLGLGAHNGTGARVPGQLIDWAVREAARNRAATGDRPGSEAEPVPVDATAPPGAAPRGSGLAAVYGGSAQHHRALTRPEYARHLTGGLVYLPDLATTDLTGYGGLVIPERLHRGLLTRAADRILGLLDAGGTVIAFTGGEPAPEFLPGVRWEHRPTNYWWWLEPGAGLGLVSPTPDHPLFDHLTLRDCTWHYHGALDPPAGAEVLVALPGGEALLYVDRVSTPGTLVVATLDPMSHYGSHFMRATERFLDGFLPWAADATARIRR